MCAAAAMNTSDTERISREREPSSAWYAALAACSPCAEIMFMTDSASERSSLPFRKARFVNSPGPAGSAPAARTRRRTFCMRYMPPWHCSSTTSSPVYDAGARNTRQMAWSTASPVASTTVPKSAVYPGTSASVRPEPFPPSRVSALFAGTKTFEATLSASPPEMRTMPMPPAAFGVAMAATVRSAISHSPFVTRIQKYYKH